MRELILIPGAQVTIQIQVAEGGAESGVIVTVRMSRVFRDGTGPAHGHSTKARDDVEDLALITDVRVWAESEHKGAGGDEVRELRDLAGELGRRLNLGIAELFMGAVGDRGRLLVTW